MFTIMILLKIPALSQTGSTPLFIASQIGHSDIVTILVRSAAKINMAMNVSDNKTRQ